jgi:hypothetical protein
MGVFMTTALREVVSRTRPAITVRELAKKSGIGYERTQRILREQREPHPAEVEALRRAAGLDR